MKHVWLDLDGKTYGMTSTLDRTFWGGPAVIESPDFVSKKWWKQMTRKKCRPLYRNKNVPHLQFAQNLKCVADQLSVDKKSRQIQTRPLLDYHFLKNNCAAATRLIVECAGGQVSLRPNLSVGDKFEWDQIVYGEIEYKNYVISESNYETTIKDVCNKVRESCGMGLLAN